MIRTDLGLSYVQVGVLISVPGFFGNVLEPAVGVLGDAWDRRRLIRLGGGLFAVTLLAVALSPGFVPLLLALMLLSPASGAFVGLSQATLMDLDARAHERNMALWTLAGSVGVVAGPLLLGIAVGAGAGWRAAFAACAVASALALALVWRTPPPGPSRPTETSLWAAIWRGTGHAIRALRRREVLRWLILLQFADLLLDVLHGFLALYFVDAVGLSGSQAGLAVAVWTGVGLLGSALLIPALQRMDGLRYLRGSALLALVLFPAFLLVDHLAAKLALLGVLGLLDAGWYAILQGRLYSEMPGQSGTVLALGNVSGLAGSLLPLALGVVAERLGLSAAMWLFLAAPAALLVGLPRQAVTGVTGSSQRTR